jgi:tetratricopeptide (TPR) repeat protein
VSRARVLAALTLAVLLGGCVYYNGMYNTKRLAGSARKAERDGRTFEANDLWGQVITRAESLVARHPDSKYVDEALVLKGLALSRLQQCHAAVAPLGRVSLLPDDAEVREEASLALGRCQLELGDLSGAETMFARVVASEDRVRRDEARLLRGRTLRLTGRSDEAVAALENLTGPRARDERLLALAAARRRDAALALADSMLATRDSTARWDTVTAGIGRADPLVASAIVDRLKRRKQIAPGLLAQMLYEDGVRLLTVDSARGEARLNEVAALGQPPEYVERARLAMLRRRMAGATSAADLRPLLPELEARLAARTTASSEAAQLRDMVSRVIGAVDSLGAGAAQADLHLFLAGETARDSLAAPVLAADLFRTLAERLPDSPYAPKAILAGNALDPAWGASVLPVLEERYALNPYVALLRGDEPYGYRELEDSLQIFARGLGLGTRSAPPPPILREDSIAGARGASPRPRRGLDP